MVHITWKVRGADNYRAIAPLADRVGPPAGLGLAPACQRQEVRNDNVPCAAATDKGL